MSEKLAREEVLGKGVKKAFFEDGEKL